MPARALPLGLARAAGPLRHPPAGRPARGAQRPRPHRARRRRVHRADGHVLPRDGRCRGAAAVLLQGRRAGLRARARRAHARLPELRRQRDVPVLRQRAAQPARRSAVHRLRRRAPVAAARRGRRDGGARRPARATWPEAQFVVRVRADARLSQLPALHPPHGARRALAVRAAGGPGHAGAGVEARFARRRACCPRAIRRRVRPMADTTTTATTPVPALDERAGRRGGLGCGRRQRARRAGAAARRAARRCGASCARTGCSTATTRG